MKLISAKEYIIEKDNESSALISFRGELSNLNLSQQDRIRLLEEFRDAYRRSNDYDLAFSRVFDDIVKLVGKSQIFKQFWRNLISGSKNLVGKNVLLDGDVYQVIAQSYRGNGINRYIVKRYEKLPDNKIKVIVHAYDAEEDELKVMP